MRLSVVARRQAAQVRNLATQVVRNSQASEIHEQESAGLQKSLVEKLLDEAIRLALRRDRRGPNGDEAMTATEDLSTVPSAKALMEKIALAEADKASEEMRRRASEEAEKRALIERLTKPSGLSDEEVMKKAAVIIERAAKNGLTEVQVYRFPNTLCTDRGRAINQQEPGWETTLTGVPNEIYQFWDRRLRPLGYRLRVQIIDFSGGVPGDVGMTLKWG